MQLNSVFLNLKKILSLIILFHVFGCVSVFCASFQKCSDVWGIVGEFCDVQTLNALSQSNTYACVATRTKLAALKKWKEKGGLLRVFFYSRDVVEEDLIPYRTLMEMRLTSVEANLFKLAKFVMFSFQEEALAYSSDGLNGLYTDYDKQTQAYPWSSALRALLPGNDLEALVCTIVLYSGSFTREENEIMIYRIIQRYLKKGSTFKLKDLLKRVLIAVEGDSSNTKRVSLGEFIERPMQKMINERSLSLEQLKEFLEAAKECYLDKVFQKYVWRLILNHPEASRGVKFFIRPIANVFDKVKRGFSKLRGAKKKSAQRIRN